MWGVELPRIWLHVPLLSPPESVAESRLESGQLVTCSLVWLPEEVMLKRNCWKRIEKLFSARCQKRQKRWTFSSRDNPSALIRQRECSF